MKLSLLNVLTICGLCLFAASTADARRLHVFRSTNGQVAVTDLEEGKTYYPRDPKKFIEEKYMKPRRVEGFGKKISTKEFAKGQSPVAPVAEQARQTAQDSTRLPFVGKLLRPVSTLMGRPDYPNR